MIPESWRNGVVAVVGLGKSGVAATKLLAQAGARVYASDAAAQPYAAIDGLRGLPLDQTRKNLQAILDKVKAKYPAVKIVLAGMLVPPNMGKTYSDEFKNIYPDLSKKNKATLIPFLLNGVGGVEKLNQADGIHPNVEGHQIVARNLTPVFRNLIH